MYLREYSDLSGHAPWAAVKRLVTIVLFILSLAERIDGCSSSDYHSIQNSAKGLIIDQRTFEFQSLVWPIKPNSQEIHECKILIQKLWKYGDLNTVSHWFQVLGLIICMAHGYALCSWSPEASLLFRWWFLLVEIFFENAARCVLRKEDRLKT